MTKKSNASFAIGTISNSTSLSFANFFSSSDGYVTNIKSVSPFIKLAYALYVSECVTSTSLISVPVKLDLKASASGSVVIDPSILG